MPLSAPLAALLKIQCMLVYKQSLIRNTTHLKMNFLTQGVHTQAFWVKIINELEISPCCTTLYVTHQTITLNWTNAACTKLTSVIQLDDSFIYYRGYHCKDKQRSLTQQCTMNANEKASYINIHLLSAESMHVT